MALARKYWTERKHLTFQWSNYRLCFRQTRQHLGALQEKQTRAPAGSGQSCCYAPLTDYNVNSSSTFLKQGALDRVIHASANCHASLSSNLSLLKFMQKQLDNLDFQQHIVPQSVTGFLSQLCHNMMIWSVQWTLNHSKIKWNKTKQTLQKTKPLT